jgi:hypothetical protein
MSHRIALFIAAAMTAFVLVIGGALAGGFTSQFQSLSANIAGKISNGNTAKAAENSEEVSTQTQDSSEIQVLLEREAAYQELIRQANERLQAVYADRQALAGAPQPAINMSQAILLMKQWIPEAVLLDSPRLVGFQGSAAYELELEQGMAYVDAYSGQVIFNGLVLTLPSAAPPPAFLGFNGGPSKGVSFTDETGSSGSQGGDDDSSGSQDEDDHEDEDQHEDEDEYEDDVDHEIQAGV